MESLSPRVVAAAKLPILNLNEFDLWKMRIEQYFLMTDYSLWEVILNGDSPTPTKIIDGIVQVIAPTTAEQRLAKKNELKARGTLLMALLDKHQLKFNIHKDAKSLMEAIEKRMTCLNLKIYEAEVKSLSSTSQNTQNIAFVSSNNNDSTNESVSDVLSVSAASTKAPFSTLPNVDNLCDAAIYSFFASQSNSPQLHNEYLKQIDVNDLEEMDPKWQMAMLTMRARRFLQRTGRNLGANGTTTIGFDMSKCDGVGSYDWSFQADEEPTKYALMAFTSSSSSSSSGSNTEVFDCDELNSFESDDSVPTNPVNDRYKSGEGYHVVPPSYTRTFMPLKPYLVFNDAPPDSKTVSNVTSDSEDESELESVSNQKEPSFVPTHEHVKTPMASIKTVEHPTQAENLRKDIPKSSDHKHSWTRKACFVCKSLNHLIKDYNYYKKQVVQKPIWNHAMRVNHQNSAMMTHPHSNKHVVPTAVLTRSRLVPINAARPITTVVPHPTIKSLKPVQHVVNKAHSPIRMLINHIPAPKNSNFYQKVTTVKAKKVNAVKGTKGNWLPNENHVLLRVPRENNMYNVDLKNIVPSGDLTCLFAKATLDESNLWHRRLGYINFKTMNKLVKGNLVKGLPSRFWKIIILVLLVRRASNIEPLLCGMKGIKREFSVARTPQQNRVAERKNRTLIEAARTMLADLLLLILVWVEAVNTACYVQNRVLVTKPHNKKPYELLLGRTPSIGFMRPFGCPVTILNTLDPLGKFDGKADEGFLVGYSVNSKAFRETKFAQQYVLLPLWSTGSQNPQNTDADAAFDVKRNENGVHVSPSSSDKPKKHDEKAKKEAKGKNMPALEDIVYLDDEEYVGAEADFSNLETNISSVFATSSTEVEYVAAASCCAQVLWIQNQLLDYGQEVREAEEIKVFKVKEVKEGERIKAIDADEDINLRDMETKVGLDAKLQGRIERKDDDNAAAKEVNAAEPTVFDDEEVTMTMAQTLIKMKAEKARILNEQMAKRLHNEEVEQAAMQEKHLDNIRKYQSLKRKPISVAQARKNMIVYLKNMVGYKITHFKRMTYNHVRPIFEREYNKVQRFIKHDRDEEPTKKRVAKETLLQESFKKLRAEVEVSGSEDTPTVDPKEMFKKDVKYMLQIVPVAEFKVEALQVKHPLIDWEIHSEGSRSYWKITRVGGITQAYQSFEDMLKDFDREDMDALWGLVKEIFSTVLPTIDKEKALWVELKRLYEPSANDMIWKLQRYMHNLIISKLHSNCGVHQVSSTTRRHDMYMLSEKDYPLSNGVMTLMLSTKFQVEEDSEMARDLVMKISMKANQPKSRELVRNLLKLKFDQLFCDACKIRKQAHDSHKAKNIVLTSRCLELLHMDLFSPSTIRSYRGNLYTLVIVDDYSRYTWTRFLKNKTEAFEQFEIFIRKIQNQLGCSIVSIRTDHGREFDNEVQFGEFCNANVDNATYILNRILIRAIIGKTPYELLRCRKPTLDYFKVFGSKCFILNTKDYLTKFDPQSYKGVLLGYSQNSKAYIILNKHTKKIEESLNVTFEETPPPSKTLPLVDDDLDEEEEIKKNLENDIEDETLEVDEIVIIKESRNHPLENVIGNLNQRTLSLEDSKAMKTPMSLDTKLMKDEECVSVDSIKYRGIIGSLPYLPTSRPDIMFSVCLCARFQEAPKTSHLEAVKCIFRYIKGTTHLGLWYPKRTGMETIVYADSDYAGDYMDRKSTSGISTFVRCCLTSWFSKKQTTLAISTIKAEYVSTRKACKQALLMKQALINYDI
nr:copia protein [Tanacetum cinerariifolium]